MHNIVSWCRAHLCKNTRITSTPPRTKHHARTVVAPKWDVVPRVLTGIINVHCANLAYSLTSPRLASFSPCMPHVSVMKPMPLTVTALKCGRCLSEFHRATSTPSTGFGVPRELQKRTHEFLLVALVLPVFAVSMHVPVPSHNQELNTVLRGAQDSPSLLGLPHLRRMISWRLLPPLLLLRLCRKLAGSRLSICRHLLDETHFRRIALCNHSSCVYVCHFFSVPTRPWKLFFAQYWKSGLSMLKKFPRATSARFTLISSGLLNSVAKVSVLNCVCTFLICFIFNSTFSPRQTRLTCHAEGSRSLRRAIGTLQ